MSPHHRFGLTSQLNKMNTHARMRLMPIKINLAARDRSRYKSGHLFYIRSSLYLQLPKYILIFYFMLYNVNEYVDICNILISFMCFIILFLYSNSSSHTLPLSMCANIRKMLLIKISFANRQCCIREQQAAAMLTVIRINLSSFFLSLKVIILVTSLELILGLGANFVRRILDV